MMPIFQNVYYISICNPQRAVSPREDRVYPSCRQALSLGVGNDSSVSEHVDAAVGGDPDVPFMILEDQIDLAARQAIRNAEMLCNPVVDAVQTIRGSPDPQSMFPVDEQCIRTYFAPVKTRNYIVGPFPLREPENTQARTSRMGRRPDSSSFSGSDTVNPRARIGTFSNLVKVGGSMCSRTPSGEDLRSEP